MSGYFSVHHRSNSAYLGVSLCISAHITYHCVSMRISAYFNRFRWYVLYVYHLNGDMRLSAYLSVYTLKYADKRRDTLSIYAYEYLWVSYAKKRDIRVIVYLSLSFRFQRISTHFCAFRSFLAELPNWVT